MNVKQVIVVRKDLNMRKGKLAAQVAHASMKVLLDLMEKRVTVPYLLETWRLDVSIGDPMDWWLNGSFAKVVVSVDSLEELMGVYLKAQSMNIYTSLIEDEGRTEFHGEKTITCVAIGPDTKSRIDSITGHLKLL